MSGKTGEMTHEDRDMQRAATSMNKNQGTYKRVLCVCVAGVLRSPTAALLLSQEPYNFNTRSAGINPMYALVILDDVLLFWADEVVCMEPEMVPEIRRRLNHIGYPNKPVLCLEIPDDYDYREPALMVMIQQRYEEVTKARQGGRKPLIRGKQTLSFDEDAT